MDDLDAMILRELTWRPGDPLHVARGLRRPWDAARALGLHGTTVKRRLADMREAGILRGVFARPLSQLTGRRSAEFSFTFADAAAKRRGLDYLANDPHVWEIYGFVGNGLTAVLATPEGEDIHADARRLAVGAGADSLRFHHLADWPVPVEKFSALDLRILAAHADDAFRPVNEVAAEIGIAPKTVTARMRALAQARAYIVHPWVDYAKIAGGMTVYFDLTLALGTADAAHTEIANRFPLAICRSVKGAENGYVVLHAAGATDVEEIVQRAETIPGVEKLDMHILHDVVYEPARWKDALLARAEELARAKGIWAPAWRAKPVAIADARPK